jgi:hypothetical protein
LCKQTHFVETGQIGEILSLEQKEMYPSTFAQDNDQQYIVHENEVLITPSLSDKIPDIDPSGVTVASHMSDSVSLKSAPKPKIPKRKQRAILTGLHNDLRPTSGIFTAKPITYPEIGIRPESDDSVLVKSNKHSVKVPKGSSERIALDPQEVEIRTSKIVDNNGEKKMKHSTTVAEVRQKVIVRNHGKLPILEATIE